MGHFLWQAAEWAAEQGRIEREEIAFQAFCEEEGYDPDSLNAVKAWGEYKFWDGFQEPDPDFYAGEPGGWYND